MNGKDPRPYCRHAATGIIGGKDFYEVRGIQIDFKNSRIIRDGRMTDLSEREARLLRYFVERQGQVLRREELLRAVWGYNFLPFSRTVDVHVAWLRQKMEEDPRQPGIDRDGSWQRLSVCRVSDLRRFFRNVKRP